MHDYIASPPTLWVERVSLTQVKTLLFMLSASAATPTALVAGSFIYLQSALGIQVKPEHIVAGMILVVMLSFFILWRFASRTFALLDAVPGLQRDVASICEDVSDLSKAVRELKTVGEQILRRDEAREWRVEQLEKAEARRTQEERERWRMERPGGSGGGRG